METLGRDSTWRMKHACPACTYKLEGEDALIFDMLTTMDGNDSLKRVLRRSKTTMEQDETGEPTLAKSSERVDSRDAGDGYYISRERVDKWAKARVTDRLATQAAGGDVSHRLKYNGWTDAGSCRTGIIPVPIGGRTW